MPGESDMLDAPAAARKAAEYLETMIPPAQAVLLEEVEKEEEGDKVIWLITLSFAMEALEGKSDLLPGLVERRKYKTFAIDAHTGEVKSMKIGMIQ